MKSKATLFGHAIHPMLVAFPVAFYTGALVSYIVYEASDEPFWFRLAVVSNVAGVIMAVVAAIPGFIDWLLAIPDRSAAKVTGLKHMLANVLALIIFATNGAIQLARWDEIAPPAGVAIVLSLAGMIATAVAGFLGWTLTQKHHVGVDLTPEQERLEPDFSRTHPPIGTAGTQRT